MPVYNGVYRRDTAALDRWWFPWYAHASSGMQLYRYQSEEQWRVGAELNPDEDFCTGHIGSVGGEVPVGAQSWQCSVNGKFEESTVTVRELVRALTPLVPSAGLLFTVCRFNPPMEFICLEVTRLKLMSDVCD